MRRTLVLMTLMAALASLAASAGALRCACCAPGSEAAIKTTDLCCPSDDTGPCSSQALKPSSTSPLAALAEPAGPGLPPTVGASAAGSMAFLEHRALAARPSGRDGLAMRSILRI